MQATWSLIFNVLLLMVVVVTIVRMMRVKRQHERSVRYQPPLGDLDRVPVDDVIAVRKITPAEEHIAQVVERVEGTPQEEVLSSAAESRATPTTVMLFLSAQEGQMLAGYELLQVLLAAGLRFGEGHLFHRHQNANGQGPILCSLAAATPSGVFDLQNIGAFSVRGLCLFMQASGNATIDEERFDIMLETAKQLNHGLGTRLLDDQQSLWSEASADRYRHALSLCA